MVDYRRVHEEAIVFDGTCPLLTHSPAHTSYYVEGGVTVVAPSLAANHNCGEAIGRIANWLNIIRERSHELLHVTDAAGFRQAKADGSLGILFHFQNSLPLEQSIELVDVYHALGVRVIQLTYNVRNFVGDGCLEPNDAGLSAFGRRLIKAMNRAGIAVDCSHTGIQTTLDAMDVSEQPVVFSHNLTKAVCDSPRNLTDEQIKRVAEMGGVIGINGFPPFVAKKQRPTLDDLLKHVDHIADLVGIEHAGIGIDFEYIGDSMQEASKAHYDTFVKTGQWDPKDYPPPPYYYPRGLDDPRRFPNLTKALLERGYDEVETKEILGGNFMRVYSQIWT
ncbi:MAG: dipeptidase [Chloroflexi bacterium]|nr:dipeptidase [Chloroflexota bacterium]